MPKLRLECRDCGETTVMWSIVRDGTYIEMIDARWHAPGEPIRCPKDDRHRLVADLA